MKGFFITGTDTDVGKTIISATLMLALKAHYWKPIQSGESDTAKVRHLTELPGTHFLPSIYSLKASLSPNQAAELENTKIELSHCHSLITEHFCIVEGAGGVFTPLADQICLLDLMKLYQLPIIIVSRGTLGCINHALLTLAVLRQHQLPIQGIVFSGELNPRNQADIEKFGKVKTLFHLPQLEVNSPNILKTWVAENQSYIKSQLQIESSYEY